MRSAVVRGGLFGFGILVMVCGMAAPAFAAAPPAVPEIDGGSLAAGLAALSAGVMIVRSRRRAK
jgi:hypothetical protein